MPPTEADVEQAALNWLSNLGWQTTHGPDIAPTTANTERADYAQVVLDGRLRDTLARLNPDLPTAALGDAFGMITRLDGAALDARNSVFHWMRADGVRVACRMAQGRAWGSGSHPRPRPARCVPRQLCYH